MSAPGAGSVTDPRKRLRDLIDRFLAGDHSIRLVNEIEGLLLSHFSGSQMLEDIGEDLALYNPAQGRPYVGVDELAEKLSSILTDLGEA